jgi:hypothetical protein
MCPIAYYNSTADALHTKYKITFYIAYTKESIVVLCEHSLGAISNVFCSFERQSSRQWTCLLHVFAYRQLFLCQDKNFNKVFVFQITYLPQGVTVVSIMQGWVDAGCMSCLFLITDTC